MIPIIINNRNRITTLKLLINWIQKLNNIEIIILDNNSTYEPLIQYYKEIEKEIQIRYLKENMGIMALYITKEHEKHKSDIFVYTDSDVLPIEKCPLDVMEIFKEELLKHQYNKVGFGLEIKDLPDCYKLKNKVIEWESQFWKFPLNNKFFKAAIGHTFALYHKSHSAGKFNDTSNCLRSNYPYVAKHLPWYVDSNNLDNEELYYNKHATALKPDGLPVSSWGRGLGIANGNPYKKTFL